MGLKNSVTNNVLKYQKLTVPWEEEEVSEE